MTNVDTHRWPAAAAVNGFKWWSDVNCESSNVTDVLDVNNSPDNMADTAAVSSALAGKWTLAICARSGKSLVLEQSLLIQSNTVL